MAGAFLLGLAGTMASAGSVDPALLTKRIGEIEALRAQRLAPDDPPKVPTEAYAKVAAGEVYTTLESVPGHKAKKALGVVVADVPIERMWAAVNDESSKVDNTRLSYLEVLEGDNCKDQRLVLQFLPITLASDRWWVVRQTMNSALSDASGGQVREVQWKSVEQWPETASSQAWMDKGIPIAYTRGAWFLVALDEQHTLIEYYTWTDPGGAIPAGIASSFAAGGISDTFATMTKLAKASPACL